MKAMLQSFSWFAGEVRDFFQYAFGDRKAVIARFSERSQRAWEEIYHP